MPRATKHAEFRRFSLRIPVELLKKVQHEAIDQEVSANDVILDVITNVDPRRTIAIRGVKGKMVNVRRYPLRIPSRLLLKSRGAAHANCLSINGWINATLRRELR